MLRSLLTCTCLFACTSASFAGPPVRAIPSPATTAIDVNTLSPAAYADLVDEPRIRLRGLPLAGLPAAGIELERFDALAADAELVLMTSAGPRSLSRPALALFRSAIDDPACRVVLSVSPAGVYGLVRTPESQLVLSTGPAISGLPLSIADAATLDGPLPVEGAWCAVEGDEWRAPDADGPPAGETDLGEGACRKLRIAIDTDNEYLSNLFGGDTAAATAYVGTLIGAVAQIYTWDLHVTFEISFIRLWSTPDPWGQTSTGAQLYEFQDYWIANQQTTQRGVTHYLSGRGLGGGVAYLSALCGYSYAYGLSANLAGSFPYPIQNNSGANWDLMVVSHELGHNFGAPHTHSMNPSVDCCGGAYGGNCDGLQSCVGANMGTIMSYCHTCPGGMANVRMEFHPRTIDEAIAPYMSSVSCFIALPHLITDQPDPLSRLAGASAAFAVTAVSSGDIQYQWRRNGVNVYDDAHRSGTDTPTLTINPVAAADAGTYDCILMGLCGLLASNPATLTVTPPGGCPGNKGDANCDGQLDFFDIDPFLSALFSPPSYAATYCGGSVCSVDGDCNAVVDFFDIDPFLACLFDGCANCP